jgi:ribosomal protein L37AE/L43A
MPEEVKCPKCNEELDWQSGSSMEWEIWYCSQCDIEYEVDVELVRYWDTIKERY